MNIKIISIGNNPPKWVQDILVKYTSRFDAHFKIELIEIKSEKTLNHWSIKKNKKLKKSLNLSVLILLSHLMNMGHLVPQKVFQKNCLTGCKTFLI